MTALAVTAGETVRLRFRGSTPDGRVARPGEHAVGVTVTGPEGEFPVTASADWDGRQWLVLVGTDGWAPGTYTARASVWGGHGKGTGTAEITVS